MNKKIFLSLVALIVFAIGAFFVGEFWLFGGNISTEAALPKDSDYVVTFDYSNSAQVKNVRDLLAMFPETGFSKKLDEFIAEDEGFKGTGLDYEKEVKPIFEKDWKVSVAIDLAEAGDEVSGGGVLVCGYFEESGMMEKVLEKLKSEDVFYAKDGDIFIIARNQAEVDSAVKRLNEGGGFNENASFKNVKKNADGNIAYVYVKAEGYAEVIVGKDGLKLVYTADPALDKKNLPYYGKKAVLAGKVPLENPILYVEYPLVKEVLSYFGDYDSWVGVVGDFSGVSVDDVKGILESPFALAVGDVGEKYPTVSVNFAVDEKYVESAKKLTNALDKYSDAVIQEFEAMVGAKDALKKDVSVVAGGGLHKLYIDWKSVPQELIANWNLLPGLDVKNMKVEVYYGVTGDNVFTVSLYPGFDKAYGENTVLKEGIFASALDEIGGKNPCFVFFLSPQKLFDFVDVNYYKIMEDAGMISDEYKKDYSLVKGVFETLRHVVVSYGTLDGDNLINAFVKLQKVENKAMDKVKEGK